MDAVHAFWSTSGPAKHSPPTIETVPPVTPRRSPTPSPPRPAPGPPARPPRQSLAGRRRRCRCWKSSSFIPKPGQGAAGLTQPTERVCAVLRQRPRVISILPCWSGGAYVRAGDSLICEGKRFVAASGVGAQVIYCKFCGLFVSVHTIKTLTFQCGDIKGGASTCTDLQKIFFTQIFDFFVGIFLLWKHPYAWNRVQDRYTKCKNPSDCSLFDK